MTTEFQSSQFAAQQLGMKLSYWPVRNAQELDSAFKAIAEGAMQAIVAFPDAFTLDQREDGKGHRREAASIDACAGQQRHRMKPSVGARDATWR